ncbi:hypothetical protein [Myxococcus fulvus]|uniref:hypothetical protein n=1 Tax=Myxococcus fulvus TaxID=33 RepID=UPI003CD00613
MPRRGPRGARSGARGMRWTPGHWAWPRGCSSRGASASAASGLPGARWPRRSGARWSAGPRRLHRAPRRHDPSSMTTVEVSAEGAWPAGGCSRWEDALGLRDARPGGNLHVEGESNTLW